jgi:hypothetical protein
MTRDMIDTTHNGFPTALPVIKTLAAGSIVALYDTGSPNIAATPTDIAQVPHTLTTVFIDQGFTGSPNLSATVRDCENGAWTLADAVNTKGWNVPRPTLYLGFPDTAQDAANAGWKGDVWLARPGSKPVVPPVVPAGLNVVAVQYDFSNPAFDRSVVFDAAWPNKAVPPVPHTITQSHWAWCRKCQGLFYGPNVGQSHCPAGGQHSINGSGNYSLTDTIT